MGSPTTRRASRPPAALAEERDQRRDEQRANDERVEQHADAHRERELAERPQVDQRERREREREREAGDGDRPRGARRGRRDRLAQRRPLGVLPDPADHEDVVVGAKREQEHGHRERHVVRQLAVAEEALEDQRRQPDARGQRERRREHEVERRERSPAGRSASRRKLTRNAAIADPDEVAESVSTVSSASAVSPARPTSRPRGRRPRASAGNRSRSRSTRSIAGPPAALVEDEEVAGALPRRPRTRPGISRAAASPGRSRPRRPARRRARAGAARDPGGRPVDALERAGPSARGCPARTPCAAASCGAAAAPTSAGRPLDLRQPEVRSRAGREQANTSPTTGDEGDHERQRPRRREVARAGSGRSRGPSRSRGARPEEALAEDRHQRPARA